MNVFRCDACGDEYQAKKDGAGLLQLAILSPGSSPDARSDTPDSFLRQMLEGRASGNREEQHKFDLCYECALATALALKHRKADVRAGRRPV